MYTEYTSPITQKPRRKLWLTIVIVVLILIGAAGVGFLVTMGTVRVNEQQMVKDEIITQNTRLRLNIKDGAVAPEAIATIASTDTVAVRIAVTGDLKNYCLEAELRKEGSDIKYHMVKDTPEVEPIAGLCGDNATEKPSTPKGVTIGSTGAHSASFMWQPEVHAQRYLLECTLSSGTGSAIKASSDLHEGTVTGMLAGGTYSCRVAAENSAGQSDWSEAVTVSTTAALAVPQNLKVTARSSTQIDYSWSAVAGATDYVIEYATDPGFTKDVKQVTTKGTTGSATGLKPFTPYYFHVKAATTTTTLVQAPYSPVVQGRTDK